MHQQFSFLRGYTKHLTAVNLFDRSAALVLLITLVPVFLINTIMALCLGKNPVQAQALQDAMGRLVIFQRWSAGICRSSLLLLQVLGGKLSLCGVSLRHSCEDDDILLRSGIKAGIFSLHEVHRSIGFIEMSHGDSIRYHQRHQGLGFHIGVLAKAIFCRLVYGVSSYYAPEQFHILGLRVDNLRLVDAVNLIFSPIKGACRSVCFVNVNSVNISCENVKFRDCVNKANYVLADGSGVRIGARRMGIHLRDNINGTDLLPHICRRAVKADKSLFLMGAEPGIAERTAANLKEQFPNLRIAGTHHGYFSSADNDKVVKDINRSNADILFVAMGSPYQEQWIAENKYRLHTSVAMAVGGLFDFYSGKISRAPQWMREMGLEWIYRLAMEPRVKFNRYVIGNPLFLWRLILAS